MMFAARDLSARVFGALMAAALAASTLSTKAAGVFWFGLLIAGLATWRTRAFAAPATPVAAAAPDLSLRLARIWLVFCLLVLGLKAIPMVYWSGPWQERHGELRLLIGAFAVWLIARGERSRPATFRLIGNALALACVLSLVLVLGWTADAAPTNRIPWAAGVSLLSCTLMYASYALDVPGGQAQWWRFASFLAFLAVAFSGVRGSYLLIVVWPLMLFLFHRGQRKSVGPMTARRWLYGGAALGLVAFALAYLSGEFSPGKRIQSAISEAKAQDPNTASGARLAMWEAAAESVLNNPLLGVGFTAGKALLKRTAEKSQSREIARLGHFHSDYLHPAVEFGLLGLASYLCVGAGLLVMAIVCLRHRASIPAQGLGAILLMHASTGLTNVNFAHNYYPAVLSICVALVLLSCAFIKQSGDTAPATADI
jgi:O-antigen ligase